MSDINDYTPPSADKLSEPIYAITYSCPTVALNANTSIIYSTGALYRIRKIAHTGRVVGYDDGDSVHILGNETVRGGAIDSGIFGGIRISALYRNTATPPRYTAIESGDWSDSDIAYDDKWNVGIRITSDAGYHPPLNLSAYDYESVNNFNEFYTRYFKKGVSGNTLVLTSDPETTAVTKGLDDIVSGTPTTYFHYDRNIGFYTTAINAIFNSLNKAVVYGNSNPVKDIYYFNPDDWTVTVGGAGSSALYYLNFSNLLITKNLDDALRYIEDGTIPKDYIYDDPYTSPSASPDGGDDNNDSDGNAGSDERDDISVNLPSADAVSLSNINIYALTRDQLIAFISDMWNFSWAELATNMLTGIYNNLVDNVQSIRVLPFPANELGVVDTAYGIICGWWTHTATVQIIKTNIAGGAMPRVTVGTYEFKEVFGGWADYSPYTTIDLYLPYHGEERLDTNLFMNHTLKIEYVIDVLMGLVTYFISCDNTVVMSVSAKVSADVPVSLASGIDTFSDVLNNQVKFVESAGALRPLGMLTGSTSVSTEKLLNQSSQSGMFYMPCKCHVRITRPAYTRASNYSSRYGYPCYGSYKLSSLNGFTIVENYKGSYSKGIEKEEADEIKRLLEEGVYL